MGEETMPTNQVDGIVNTKNDISLQIRLKLN